MKHRVRRIHMIGIGGSGMCGIAEVLLSMGYDVSGSDLSSGESVTRLAALGARIAIGHAARHVGDADVVVVSSAIDAGNPEVAEARSRGIPVIPRAAMLAELMRFKSGIAVAGTHGKTTTTSLIAHILAEAGLDPTVVIGGRLNAIGAHAKAGEGEYLVAEADESDASFLHLSPSMAVVTNIDRDHMDTYGQDERKLIGAFAAFIDRLPFYGLAAVCIDDDNVRALLPRLSRRIATYGFSGTAQLRATDVTADGGRMRFTARTADGAPLACTLNLAGRHNVLNALAAIAIAREAGVADETIAAALAGFAGVGRRFQSHGDIACRGGHFTLIDDYGHHPREMAAVIDAAHGAYPGRRLVLAFQPHRYTRTRDLFDEFVAVLVRADAVVLGEIYAAGEPPIASVSGRALAAAVETAGGRRVVFAATADALPAAVCDTVRTGDVVIAMGAGSIASLAPALARQGCAAPGEAATDAAEAR